MSRRSRLKLDGIPIHIIQRGNNRNIITLQETQKASKCQFVRLKKGPIKTFTLALDKQNNVEIHPFFSFPTSGSLPLT